MRPVPSLSGQAIAYRWRSLPRVRRQRASKPQGSSERVLPWQVTMDQLICASLSHTHSWYEVDMLKVPLVLILLLFVGQPREEGNRCITFCVLLWMFRKYLSHEVYVHIGYASSLYLLEDLCVVPILQNKMNACYCEFYWAVNGAPFSYRNRTPHLYEIFLLRFVIWLLRAYKYRQLRP